MWTLAIFNLGLFQLLGFRSTGLGGWGSLQIQKAFPVTRSSCGLTSVRRLFNHHSDRTGPRLLFLDPTRDPTIMRYNVTNNHFRLAYPNTLDFPQETQHQPALASTAPEVTSILPPTITSYSRVSGVFAPSQTSRGRPAHTRPTSVPFTLEVPDGS